MDYEGTSESRKHVVPSHTLAMWPVTKVAKCTNYYQPLYFISSIFFLYIYLI